MFEEEAEDYKNHTRIKDENTYKGFPDERISELQDFEGNYIDISERIIKTFKDAAEFGYNKANEWHKVSDELPPEDTPLTIVTVDKNQKKRLWVGQYKGGNGKYWSGYFNQFIDKPYAWKEIVLPELKESK